ncbi:MAG: tetratricopeptide repeat protein [Planctomycetota bacterium]
MKLSATFLFVASILFVVFGASISAQDMPEKSTDSLHRNDSLFNLFTSVKPHSLTDVRAKPEAYRGLPVQMEIQFHESRSMANPFFTRFTEDNYYCFSAWGIEQPLWDKEEYKKDFAFFFVDRKSIMFRRTLDAKMYNRMRVKATVRDIFRGIPYIEITDADILGGSVTEATIIHGAKAKKLVKEGNTAGALAEYERAMRGDIPEVSKAQFHIDMAEVYIQRSERDNAISQLENAKKLVPTDMSIAIAVDKIKAMPANALRMDEIREVFGQAKAAPANAKLTEPVASRPAAQVVTENAKKEVKPPENSIKSESSEKK